MNYKDLINEVEKKRCQLYIKYKKSIFFKNVYKLYFNKYDELLIDLYTKYSNKIIKTK